MSLTRMLSQTDSKTKNAVYGFIRDEKHNSSNIIIPSMIAAIIIIFYRNDEHFEITASDIITSKNKKKISKIGKEENFENGVSYGINQISTTNNTKIYTWTVKINKLYEFDSLHKGHFKHFETLGIGLSSNINLINIAGRCRQYLFLNDGTINRYPPDPDDINVYFYKYGDLMRENDIITMELNLNTSQITYFINGINKGVAYKNIIKGENIKYRFMVTMGFYHNEVEIISYSESQ